MLLDTRLQAYVEVELILLVVACPGHLFEAVGLCVDELGVLGHRLVGVPVNSKSTRKIRSYRLNP
jgi:hypothetical protein